MDPTLPQRLYLLTCTVEKGRFEVVDLQGRGQLLRAGALAELAFGGLLATEGGKVHRMVTEPPADPFLREVWSDLPVKKPKGWLQFVYPTAHMAEAPVTEQLAGAGRIRRPEGRHRGLGSYHRTTGPPSRTRTRCSPSRRRCGTPYGPTRRRSRRTSWPWWCSPSSAR
ncbi:GPP34 family phosphoprotein [Streptomyces microflavus]|uniref:GOLPH3/VPS74 family protein n=1 Tax=Streptomyces microflavus TaxID=1919 RepID=UPI0036CE9800